MIWNQFSKETFNLRWILTVLVAVVGATALGFVIGMWLGS